MLVVDEARRISGRGRDFLPDDMATRLLRTAGAGEALPLVPAVREWQS
jgi:hypothetical protein